MALKTNARYAFGLKYVRMFPLNFDLSLPSPTRIAGGVGPFDMSGATAIAAVPLTIKIDAETAVSVTVDLSAAVDQSAVTVEEVVAAMNIALAAADVTASKEALTGYLLLVYDGVLTPNVLQVYGELAELTSIGQGFGVKYLISDTITSMNETAVRKDGERITVTDANGFDTSILTDGYYKGFTSAIVDTAEDWDMFALCEGLYLSDTGSMSSPTSSTVRPFIGAELYYGRYRQGENREPELKSYVQKIYNRCKALSGDVTHERAFAAGNYTLEGTTFVDDSGIEHSAWDMNPMTIAEFKALNIENV